jgi:hypothetical protein
MFTDTEDARKAAGFVQKIEGGVREKPFNQKQYASI